jgi:hypothetical protein
MDALFETQSVLAREEHEPLREDLDLPDAWDGLVGQ